jgi:hypothetical protein
MLLFLLEFSPIILETEVGGLIFVLLLPNSFQFLLLAMRLALEFTNHRFEDVIDVKPTLGRGLDAEDLFVLAKGVDGVGIIAVGE